MLESPTKISNINYLTYRLDGVRWIYDLPTRRYAKVTTVRKQKAVETRERLLQAAISALQRQGVHALTLDAVAREAHVSKGGLLHHFPSKDALSEAVLRQLFGDFETRVNVYYETEPPAPGRWLRAYVRATYEEDSLPLELVTLLLVAVAENRDLLRLIQADTERWQQRLANDGIPAARATVVRQAADAYWTERLIEPAYGDKTVRQAVMEDLLQLSRET